MTIQAAREALLSVLTKQADLLAFEEEFGEERDVLSLRRFRGERLTEAEAARLETLNARLKSMLEPPIPLPQEARDAIAEAHRLLGREPPS